MTRDHPFLRLVEEATSGTEFSDACVTQQTCQTHWGWMLELLGLGR